MDLFAFGDYRAYIRAFFDARKRTDARYSMARLGKSAGMSKVAIKYLLDGRRHIATDTIDTWLRCLELSGDAATYFRHLVLFNKARGHADRTQHFNGMLAVKGGRFGSRVLAGADIGLFQAWYYPVIAELSYCDGFVADPEWIRKRLRFPVGKTLVAKALAYLDANGHLRRAGDVAAKGKTPDEIASHVYKAFVIDQTRLAADAIASLPAAARESFTLTVSIDAARYDVLKARIAAIRHELHDLLANTDAADRVIQVNLNMFTTAGVDDRA
jgi:uncharacterized protein (TIGR02147 family)